MIDPSKPLADSQQEKFCLLLAKGGTDQTSAYAAAGYKPNSSHASRLVGKGSVKARIAWLKAHTAEKVTTKAAMEQSRALVILADIAEGTATSESVEPHARIAALNLIGKWSKWETGTDAENKVADALGDEISAIRNK